jgi:hypothetical protein
MLKEPAMASKLFCVLLVGCGAALVQSFETTVQPFPAQCRRSGSCNLSQSAASVAEFQQETGEKILANVEAGEMLPSAPES